MLPATTPALDFDNLADWDVRDNVDVFDEHDEYAQERDSHNWPVFKEGKPVMRLIRRFDKPTLEKIAANCNERERIGALCPLTIGHTFDGENIPEKDQPEIVGYARKFAVAWSEKLNRWVIRCSYYLKRDRLHEAEKYPRTSVEIWGGKDLFFDPIALIKVTPDRPLSQWTYSRRRRGPVLRYSMATEPMSGAAPAAATTEGDNRPMEERDEEKFCHRLAKHFAKCYAEHCNNDPIYQYMKRKFEAESPAGPGSPSGSNTFVPGTDLEKPGNPEVERHAKKPDPETARVQAVDSEIRFQQLEKRIGSVEQENTTLRGDNATLQRKYRRATRERDFVNLKQVEGFDLDLAEELDKVQDFTDEQHAAHLAHIRKRYAKSPASRLMPGSPGDDFIRTTDAAPANGKGDEPATKDENRQIVSHATRMKIDIGSPAKYGKALKALRAGTLDDYDGK
jgi:hypothetical protein